MTSQDVFVSRHRDALDAHLAGGEWLQDIFRGNDWPAPKAIQLRQQFGMMGTGASSDDRITSLWINDRVVAVTCVFRDISNFAVCVRTYIANPVPPLPEGDTP